MEPSIKPLVRRMVELDYKYKNNHLASALSALPVIKKIYDTMRPEDVFVLSKGHACLALYVVLESKGYSPDFSKIHPDMDIKNGISCTTGSLGHGLPMATGMAWAKKLKNEKGDVYVLMGDGECQEGTTWESLLTIERFNLSNLMVYVDYNEYQAIERLVNGALNHIKTDFSFVNIVHHIKGCGLSLFKEHPSWHVHQLTEDEYLCALEELK